MTATTNPTLNHPRLTLEGEPSQRPAKLHAELPQGRERFARSRGPQTDNNSEPQIDRDGGTAGAGLISGVSLATRGEALGHGMWMDLEAISQVATFANAGEAGLKSRFTHPGMSSDGLGRHLGRIQETEVMGDQAIGNLHLAMLSHNTPEGDLADYVMDLADEDPQAAGLSIVFE
jgi:hypothetical protein